ncbi:hypothetical protein NAL32_21610 [Chryseobacterium sp. Ch-15]|uniref:Uncharacterized protein n=1 Tax=Chryseobacterium muglaense TaxID=2893752 RepID=A0A9Q3UPM9_9FLAO|nr:hypothetical protein [Chryseobacterium muglaense]MBD3907103.1 hypothetical protein [Chryseobacterium muglaense]MCC9033118.1 hypothetical protein [Chryseobacterium muglaense]MCM2556987.1 hypothetical protein [Chryseobacterium muglaense]
MRKKKTTENSLIKTIDQAKISFAMLLQKDQKGELVDGIFKLIEKTDNPEIDKLLDQYPDILQKNDLKELLSGNIEILNVSKPDIKTVGIVSCLLALLSFCSELTDSRNKIIPLSKIKDDNIALPAIQYIIRSISLEDLLEHLLLTIISIVGIDYYEKFQQKIDNKKFPTEDILKLDTDPELKQHMDLMLWLVLIRLFLESVYCYFNNENHNTKKPLL